MDVKFTSFFSEIDLDNIKIASRLCIAGLDCFVRFTSEFIQDVSGNQVSPVVPVSSILDALNTLPVVFTPDSTSPNLIAFDFDLNTRRLVFEFDEPVDVGSFRHTDIVMQSDDSASPRVEIRLTTFNPLSTDGRVLVIELAVNDIQLIQDSDLASSRNDTWLTHTSALGK